LIGELFELVEPRDDVGASSLSCQRSGCSSISSRMSVTALRTSLSSSAIRFMRSGSSLKFGMVSLLRWSVIA
jgi:hypothetical protein